MPPLTLPCVLISAGGIARFADSDDDGEPLFAVSAATDDGPPIVVRLPRCALRAGFHLTVSVASRRRVWTRTELLDEAFAAARGALQLDATTPACAAANLRITPPSELVGALTVQVLFHHDGWSRLEPVDARSMSLERPHTSATADGQAGGSLIDFGCADEYDVPAVEITSPCVDELLPPPPTPHRTAILRARIACCLLGQQPPSHLKHRMDEENRSVPH